MGYKIYPLNTGFLLADVENQSDQRPGPHSSQHVPATAFLVTNGNHHLLFDTGSPPTAEVLKHRPNSAQPRGFDIVNRLEQKGLFPQALHAIVLSHLHWDHCAYLDQFSGVRKLVQKKETDFAADPSPDYRLSYQGADLLLADPDLEVIQDNFRYNSEIQLIPTPGHSPGHQSMMVLTHAGPHILAGDAAWCDPKKGWLPPRKAIDPEDAKKSFQGLLKSQIPLLASHDPSAARHAVYG